MSQLDQNNAQLSLAQALVPKSDLIDGRSETDQLRMLVDFASLFNFYDRTNTINGNWSPFLLKDPVFLVASIAKTSFPKAYTLFMNTCLQLERTLKNDSLQQFIANAFNQLFDQLTKIFQLMESWTQYMQESNYEYNLKTYLIQHIKETYSGILWALLELRQQLFMSDSKPDGTTNIPGIKNIDRYTFEKYDQKIWKDSKGNKPYWSILGLPTVPCKDDEKEQCFYISKLTKEQLFNSLQQTGKRVFSFLNNNISYATIELEAIKNVPGHFPDTILLRTFTSLLKIYQTQLNSLSDKHLNFYYGDILKQLPKGVTADMVFACCELTKPTATFQLAKNTTFGAGIDENKQPILFETTDVFSLNPAKIISAYTLAKADPNTKLYLQQLPPVTEVKKDESGNIQQWKTFGSGITPTGTKQDFAIAFASPMFFLAEANTRTIELVFTLSSADESDISEGNTVCFLSTEEAWFEIPLERISVAQKQNIVTLTITLQPADPVITAFTENPDGYTSDWPIFKMVFLNNINLANQAAIETLEVNVDVKELQNFQLYNDFGMLSAKKPFQPLGPSPIKGENFMVGNAEIFSKPINSLSLTINWSNFPANFAFSEYYEEYNNYLNNKYAGEPIDVEAEQKFLKQVLQSQKTFFTNVTTAQKALFQTLITADKTSAKTAIDAAGTSLNSLISAEEANLKKLVSSDSKTVKEIIAIENEMATKLAAIENELLTKFPETGPIDSTILNSTENTVLSEIINTEYQILTKIIKAEIALLDDHVKANKTLFKSIGNAFGKIFKREKDDAPKIIPLYFSNSSFLVDFQRLQNGIWESFEVEKPKDTTVDDVNLYFPITIANDDKTARIFDFSNIDISAAAIDPTLQKTPLLFSETTTTGFMKMQLTAPGYGFGFDLYPKVVGAIALYNAKVIAEKIKKPDGKFVLAPPANVPFIPTVKLFTGNYKASTTYHFDETPNTYPLECFYNTPFQNYKVYDTTNGIVDQNTTLGSVLETDTKGIVIPVESLPLTPKFSSKGQLLLELENVIAPAKVSFYFELARTYTDLSSNTKTVDFYYLSETGWKALTNITDGTNNFSCSGIISVNIPQDITNKHETMPRNNYWIAIGTKTNTDNFPQTSFLNTNGITLKRIVNATDFSLNAPQIKATTIDSPENAIPEISATIQPFASFGGKAAETNEQQNLRVSTRLKTKDRLVTSEDYFNVIRLQFPEVYYSKSKYDNATKKVQTYVIKRVADASETNAFVPLVSECTELAIQQYIHQRVSTFTRIGISNFTLNYLKIKADIKVNTDYDVTTVRKEINNGINLFLSPWITSAQTQLTIDKGINTAQIASFINSYKSILEVNSISFEIGKKNFNTGEIDYDKNEELQEFLPTLGNLIVPSLNNLTKESTIHYHL
jgi:hypothetical protein